MRNLLISVFTLMLVPVSMIHAQDEPREHELRLVCIESIGCLHTPLDDDALDAQFGSELLRFEAGGDFDTTGLWFADFDIENEVCREDLDIIEGMAERQGFFFLVSVAEQPDTITFSSDLSRGTYTRIENGVYKGIESLGDGGGSQVTVEYLMTTSETTMQAIRFTNSLANGEHSSSMAVRCYYYVGEA